MFSADGNYIITENYENDIKKINKNSQLFYDAEGALRASIMISEYGDFTVSTNYGSVKQKLSFNSDGTLRTTGGRLCLDNVCINKDDILKLKQLKSSGENSSMESKEAAYKSGALVAAKKEAVKQALENKGILDIKVQQLQEQKLIVDKQVDDRLAAQKEAILSVASAKTLKEEADKQVIAAEKVVDNANILLNDAKDAQDALAEVDAQTAKDSAEASLVSYQESQTVAQTRLDTANAENNTATTNVTAALSSQTEAGANIEEAIVKQTNAAKGIKILTE